MARPSKVQARKFQSLHNHFMRGLRAQVLTPAFAEEHGLDVSAHTALATFNGVFTKASNPIETDGQVHARL